MMQDSSRAVLPLYLQFGDDCNVVCGFVVRAGDGCDWLVTVAHATYWDDGDPNVDFERWASQLNVVDHNRGPVSVSLFSSPGKPSCRMLRIDATDEMKRGAIDDVLAVRFPLSAYQRADLFSNISTIDLTCPNAPVQPPGHILAWGYPTPDTAKGEKWPAPEPVCTLGRLVDIQRSRYWANMSCSFGYCGGPVFTDDGTFAGMVNGGDASPSTRTRIVPDFVIWALVNDRPLVGLQVPAGYENTASGRGLVPRFLPLGRIIGDGHPLSPATSTFPSELQPASKAAG